MRQVLVNQQLSRTLEVVEIDAPVGSTMVIVPPVIDVQWFIDNPVPSPDNETIWSVLTLPERRETTKDLIKEAIKELLTLQSHLKRQVRLAHQQATTSKVLRDALPFTTAEHAQRVKQIEIILAGLRQSRGTLERIHHTFNRKT